MNLLTCRYYWRTNIFLPKLPKNTIFGHRSSLWDFLKKRKNDPFNFCRGIQKPPSFWNWTATAKMSALACAMPLMLRLIHIHNCRLSRIQQVSVDQIYGNQIDWTCWIDLFLISRHQVQVEWILFRGPFNRPVVLWLICNLFL